MCGIVGAFTVGGADTDALAANLRRMADAIAHRGPDDQGVWTEAAAGIGFGHRRLSIVDLSPLGHQPMTSRSGRYTITYNGEIYNYQDLRSELIKHGHSFRGTSDTEVLLAAIEQWDLEEALRRSTGMFAIGLWDRDDRTLKLARDRFGEKPLYYGLFNHTLIFGSELKALRQHSEWRVDVSRNALTLLLRSGYIPAPYSVFTQVRKVCPGQIITITAAREGFSIAEHAYWDIAEQVAAGVRQPFSGSATEAVDETERLLKDSVSHQMVADVPVGAFLSGGVDSSLIVALMQSASSRPVKTFTIGFEEQEFNEAPYARAVADYLRTDHTELTVTARDALEVIPRLSTLYDEPFADSSQIPTYLVSALARRSVTVSLSGDAGDELFGGYTRYATVDAQWKRLQKIPYAVRWTAASVVEKTPRSVLNGLLGVAGRFDHWRGRLDVGERIWEKCGELKSRSAGELYGEMIAYFHRPEAVVLHGEEPRTVRTSRETWPAGMDDLRTMMYQDTCQYLPDDILVKVDRASMAVSLESRIPLLDPSVARFAWQIPSSYHRKDGKGKWILRQLVERHVPKALIDRPKTGFGVPVAAWLRAELRDWAQALLDPRRIASEGFFDHRLIDARWQQHLKSTTTDWSFHLWIILMFQAWLEDWNAGHPRNSR